MGTWRLLGEAAGLVVDLPDEVVGQLSVPGSLLADAGEGVVQVGVLWTGLTQTTWKPDLIVS